MIASIFMLCTMFHALAKNVKNGIFSGAVLARSSKLGMMKTYIKLYMSVLVLLTS